MKRIKCPECGKFNELGSEECTNCGYPFDKTEVSVEVKICPECGEILDEGLEVCNVCGYPFEDNDRIRDDLADQIAKAKEEARLAEEKIRIAEEKLKEEQNKKLLAEEKLQRKAENKWSENEAAKTITQQTGHTAMEVEDPLQETQNASEEIFTENEIIIEDSETSLDNDINYRAPDFENNGKVTVYEGAENTQKDISYKSKSSIKPKYKVIAGACSILLVIVLFFIIRGKQPESIMITETNVTIDQDTTKKLSYVIEPSDAKNKKVKWTSSDEKIATVDEEGEISAIGVGNCFITATTSNGKDATCKVNITPQVESITLEFTSATHKLGTVGYISYTIEPNNAGNKHVTWKSSDPSVCRVDQEGNLTGYKEGTCTITITSDNGKESSCKLTVIPNGPDLYSVYIKYCKSSFATLADDGSYLSIDTNPNDIKNHTEDDAISAIFYINEALDLPDSLIEKMSSTRALDGIQSSEYDGLEVSWSYHPDDGLEVIYEVKK